MLLEFQVKRGRANQDTQSVQESFLASTLIPNSSESKSHATSRDSPLEVSERDPRLRMRGPSVMSRHPTSQEKTSVLWQLCTLPAFGGTMRP